MGWYARLRGRENSEGNAAGRRKITDEDREKSKLALSLTKQIRELDSTLTMKNKILQIKMLQHELNDGMVGNTPAGTDEDKMFDRILKVAEYNAKKKAGAPLPDDTDNSDEDPFQDDLSDEQIDEVLEKTPEDLIEKAKKIETKKLIPLLRKKFNLTENDAIKIDKKIKDGGTDDVEKRVYG